MKIHRQHSEAPVDLGRASRRTLGGPGEMIDFVRFIHWAGLSRD
jgi:hypothetical protein